MSAPARWLILADDLTGAADCAIAFARHGRSAQVVWSAPAPDRAGPQADVLSIDVDSRMLAPAEAAARQVAAQAAWAAPGTGLYKKIDSTLRGQPSAELAAQVAALRAAGRAPLVVLAPAFPATGRVTLDGRVVVNGVALEQTQLWARDHSYPDAHMPTILASAGLAAEAAGLAEVRGGVAALTARMQAAHERGAAALVCDCAALSDLDAVAQASLALDDVVWMGSAGLAAALAKLTAPAEPLPAPVLARAGAALFVVGSAADASRRQARTLVESGRVAYVVVAPKALRAPGGEDWRAAVDALARHLGAGTDTLLQIDEREPVDLGEGAALAAGLAEMIAREAQAIGALVLTGGETARATLTQLGVHGIRLVDEVEAGVPFGVTVGDVGRPVVTKAGAFGDARTFLRCLDRLRAITPAS